MIPISSRRCSASLPVKPVLRTSTSITCVSVPPETIVKPLAINSAANTFAFLITCSAYTLNSGCNASPNATAFAAITCIKGPPWIPGNTALSIAFAYSSLHKIIPPRGPRNVLCVVVVTISAYSTGFGCKPAATRPAK